MPTIKERARRLGILVELLVVDPGMEVWFPAKAVRLGDEDEIARLAIGWALT